MTVKARARAPISSHPVFPAIVALWFAALLGVGSLVLPAALLDRMVAGSGLAALVPAAQPPLGLTARLFVALAAAGVGVVAGLWLARKVAAAQSPVSLSYHDDELEAIGRPAKRPISARDELGVDYLDAPVTGTDRAAAAIPGRRRPLSVTEETGRSDYFESAPLPGHEQRAAADPLDLAAFAEPASAPQETISFGICQRAVATEESLAIEQEDISHAFATAPQPVVDDLPVADEDALASAAPPTGGTFEAVIDDDVAATVSPAEADCIPETLAADQTAAEDRPLGELGIVELVERFAVSLQRRTAAAEAPIELPALKRPAPLPTAYDPADEGAGDPLPFEADAPTTFESPMAEEYAITEDEPDSATADDCESAPAMPTALRPLSFGDEEEDEDEDALAPLEGLSLALEPDARPFARPMAQPFVQPLAGATDVAASDDEPAEAGDHVSDEALDDTEGYGSLLAMRSPLGAGREFVRVDDADDAEPGDAAIQPVVVFPGQSGRRASPAVDGPSRDPGQRGFRLFDGPAPGPSAIRAEFSQPAMPTIPPARRADSGETERALREALEKLQRMSGAA